MKRQPAMMTIRILGRVLSYPTPDLIAALPDCRMRLAADSVLGARTRHRLDVVMASMMTRDLLDLQEDYVALFDRTPSLSLHLFEHVHGDGRDRGQALVDLMGIYQEAGLEIITAETPDYLPLFLEFLSGLSREEAGRHLGHMVDILGVLEARLVRRRSPYAPVVTALIELASRRPDHNVVRQALGLAGGASLSKAELDRSWAETPAFDAPPVTSPPDNDGCTRAAGMLRRMTR